MFKCSECGCEFEQKPDFCDCGNDIFVETVVEPNSQSSSPKQKKSFDEQYPEISRYAKSLDPISVTIFVACILLSVISVFVIKPYEKVEQEQKVVAQKTTHKVPDISTFWDDTPPKGSIINEINEEKNPTEQVKTVAIENAQPKKNTQKPQIVKQTSTQKKATTTVSKKTIQTKIPTTQTNKVTTQTNSNTSKPTTNTSSATQTIVWQPSQTQPIAAKTSVATVTSGVQELKTYKDGLRNTIGKKIDFTKVYGSGSCVVQFKVDSSGRLTDRKFSNQSTNNTLNDEVFNAVKSVPVYKAPPSSYNGQTLYLTVNFNNGHYSVSLK